MSMKRRLLGGTALLIAAFSLNEVSAETPLCTVPPTCESLGYDKNPEDCVDKAILKCPLDDTKIFCSNGPADGTAPVEGYGGGTGPNGSYEIGNLLTCNGKQIGYVIEVSENGSGGKIAGLDYEASYKNQSEGKALCQAKTDCNLVWNLTTKNELELICKARKSNIDSVMTSDGDTYTSYSAKYSSCSLSSTGPELGKKGAIYCTATFSTDKVSGTTSSKYAVGDTYPKDGIALGTVVEVDSSGQHGVIAVSGGMGTAAEASAACSAKTQGGLNWGLATGAHTCQIVKNAGRCTCTSGDSGDITCGVHSSSSPIACGGGSITSKCMDRVANVCSRYTYDNCNATDTLAYVCEAPF